MGQPVDGRRRLGIWTRLAAGNRFGHHQQPARAARAGKTLPGAPLVCFCWLVGTGRAAGSQDHQPASTLRGCLVSDQKRLKIGPDLFCG